MRNLIILKICHFMNNIFNLFSNLWVDLPLTIFSAHKGKFGAIFENRIVIRYDHIYAIKRKRIASKCYLLCCKTNRLALKLSRYLLQVLVILNMNVCISDMQSVREKMRVPPPRPPRGLGTKLWPKYSYYIPEELAAKCVTDQLADAARTRQDGERKIYVIGKHPHHKEYRAKHDRKEQVWCGKNDYCKVCSEVETEVKPYLQVTRHRHHSTLQYRMNRELNYKGEYECMTCDSAKHLYITGERIALLVTSSTMANWAINAKRLGIYPGTPFHLDSVEIPGSKVLDLLHAVICEYRLHWVNIDCVVMAGLNDLLSPGGTAAKLMKDLHRFKSVIEGMKPGNTCAVLTLPYPPKLSCLPKDKKGKWPPNFVDRTIDIWTVNEYILHINDSGPYKSVTRIAPRPQTFGLKASTNTVDRCMGKMVSHDVKGWREWRIKDMLHLADSERVKIGKSIIKYFEHLYGFEETPYLTRREAEVAHKHESEAKKRLAQSGKDMRRAISLAKERRLTEEEMLRQWDKQEEEEWRKQARGEGDGGAKSASLSDDEDESEEEEHTGGSAILRVTVKVGKGGKCDKRSVKQVWVKTCYEGNEEGCLGCCACLRDQP